MHALILRHRSGIGKSVSDRALRRGGRQMGLATDPTKTNVPHADGNEWQQLGLDSRLRVKIEMGLTHDSPKRRKFWQVE